MLDCRKNWNSNSGKVSKKVVRRITGIKETEYKSQLRLLIVLPLTMFIQLNDLLLVSKALIEENCGIKLPEIYTKGTRSNEIFKMTKTRTEKARSGFIFKTCRIANRLGNLIILAESVWLKNQILQKCGIFSRRNFLTWQLFCDCRNCRKYWTIF